MNTTDGRGRDAILPNRVPLLLLLVAAAPARAGDTLPPEPIERCEPVVRGEYASIQVNVDTRGCNIRGDAANEPTIAVDPTDARKMVIGWRQFDTVESDFRQAGYAYSHDAGHTWVFPGVLAPGVFRSDPVLAAAPDGTILYHGFSFGGPGLIFRSVDAGLTWETFPAPDADKPWMTIDPRPGEGAGYLYLNTGSSFSRSTDLGRSFESFFAYLPVVATLDVGPDGTLFVFGGGDLPSFTRSVNAQFADEEPGFSDRILLDLGGRLLTSGLPNSQGLLGQGWVATDHSNGPTHGNVYALGAVTQGRAQEGDVRLARSTDGGETWSEHVRVNDDPLDSGAYQWFAMMSVAPNGRIDAVWIDTRNYPEAPFGNLGELFYSYSTDAGDSWSDNVPISPMFDSHVGLPRGSEKLGDYYHMRSDNLGVNVAYAATFNGEQDVYFLRIGPWDCNANEIPDEDDIAARRSLDCNANDVPDECEYRADYDGDSLTTLRDYAAFQNCFASQRIDPRLDRRPPRWCIPRDARRLGASVSQPGGTVSRSEAVVTGRPEWPIHREAMGGITMIDRDKHTAGRHARPGRHPRPKGEHVSSERQRLRARCDPCCGLADVDSNGRVDPPDLPGLTRVLSGP